MKKFFLGSKNRMILLAVVAFVLTAATSWTMAKSNGNPSQTAQRSNADAEPTVLAQNLKWSKAILTVSNMSCGGCIDTIKKSVAALPGTGNVNVDLGSSTAEALYDANILTDPQTIAQAITDGGYPAKIQQLVPSQQLKKEIIEAADKAKANIAKVGRIDIPRKDYEIELAHARSRYEHVYGPDTFTTEQGKQLLQRIETQIAVRLFDEAIKFQEVDRAGYTVEKDRIVSALQDYTKQKNMTLEQLKRNLEDNGYPFDYFKRKFDRRIRLQDYLEEKVLSDSVDPDQRQQRYGNWLTNARTLAKVVYYDKKIESLVKAGSGSSCGGGGCSVSSR